MDDTLHDPAPTDRAPLDRALALLDAGIPLSLLLDLALPLDSRAVLREEPGDAAWLPAARTG